MKNTYLQLLDYLLAGSPVALVTVTATQGSTPQKPGTSALFGQSGLLSGTIGGGVLEKRVQEIAQEALKTGLSGFHHFELDKEISIREEAICGGRVTILVDASPMDHLQVFKEIQLSLAERMAGILVTRVKSLKDNKIKIIRNWKREDKEIEGALMGGLAGGNRSGYRELPVKSETDEEREFLEVIVPVPELVIAGAGHIGKALSHLGSLLDFEVTVIDDRADYASPENLPDADHIMVAPVGEALESIRKSSGTHIVIVTRGHKDDAEALRPCIGSGAAYVGMIGSKRKIALMREQFIREEWATPEQWAAIHTPIGLEIGAQTVQEIAVSIAAQLIQMRNKFTFRCHRSQTLPAAYDTGTVAGGNEKSLD